MKDRVNRIIQIAQYGGQMQGIPASQALLPTSAPPIDNLTLMSTKNMPVNVQSSQGQVLAGAIGNMALDSGANILKAKNAQNTTALQNGMNSAYDTTAQAVSQMGPYGAIVGTAMKVGGMAVDGMQVAGFRTDNMTKQDEVLGSKFLALTPTGVVNTAFGSSTGDANLDREALSTVGSDYDGVSDAFNDAEQLENKKYGLFSQKAKRKAQAKIDEANRQSEAISQIADEEKERRDKLNAMSDIYNVGYNFAVSGGINPTVLTALFGGKVPQYKTGGIMGIHSSAIVQGARHHEKNNIEIGDYTPKGIPVIDTDTGVQKAEVEDGELVIRLTVTEKLEQLNAKYKAGDVKAAVEAGEILANEIMNNTKTKDNGEVI